MINKAVLLAGIAIACIASIMTGIDDVNAE